MLRLDDGILDCLEPDNDDGSNTGHIVSSISDCGILHALEQ